MVMRSDGTHRHALTHVAANASINDLASGVPAERQPNRLFVRSDSEPTFHSEIYVMRADGTHLRRLAVGQADYNPDFSPDGKRIAFGRQQTVYPFHSQIVVMRAECQGRLKMPADHGSSNRRRTRDPEARPGDATRLGSGWLGGSPVNRRFSSRSSLFVPGRCRCGSRRDRDIRSGRTTSLSGKGKVEVFKHGARIAYEESVTKAEQTSVDPLSFAGSGDAINLEELYK
jgi:dipeptidyl aminopeptidase/acylaminoacyl peptidase